MSAGAATAEIPKRVLGPTGEHVSIVGLGGFHIGAPSSPADVMIKLIHAAIDRGITFMDNCWDYNSGMSEMTMGRALSVSGYRDRVFLMTKLDGRTAASYNAQLEESLRRLLTDRIDLVQFHENIRMEDGDRIFAPGGALEAAIAARAAGKIRFIGFTGHKSPRIHRHIFDLAERAGFRFDTVQMPINVFDAHYDSFTEHVLPVARERGTGVLAMKTFGDKNLLETGLVDPVEMLQYGMSLADVVITGIDKPEVLEQAVRAATAFQPFGDERRRAILAKTAQAAGDGALERYKTSHYFDSTEQNPSWLG